MTDGINLTGFNETKLGATNNLDLNPTGAAPSAAFPSTDMSAQGNAGLNQEGSMGGKQTGADESDMI